MKAQKSIMSKSQKARSVKLIYSGIFVNSKDCSTQISHEFAAFFLPFDVSYLLLVYICKIAAMLTAIYFTDTFILSEYYKLERGRFINSSVPTKM